MTTVERENFVGVSMLPIIAYILVYGCIYVAQPYIVCTISVDMRLLQ